MSLHALYSPTCTEVVLVLAYIPQIVLAPQQNKNEKKTQQKYCKFKTTCISTPIIVVSKTVFTRFY
jgi:hypothetical protein